MMFPKFDKWLKFRGGKLKNYYYGTMTTIFGILALLFSGITYSALFTARVDIFVISLAMSIAFAINLFENFDNIN